jgi:uncharacterized protein YoxC
MKKQTPKIKVDKYTTEDFFTKKLTETIQDLKGFMLQTFATKTQLDLKINGLREEVNIRFEQVDKRFDNIDDKLEEIDSTLTVHITDIHDHEERRRGKN